MSYSLVGCGSFGDEPAPPNGQEPPPPCDDPAKVKQLLICAGYEIPEPEPGWKGPSGEESGEQLAVGFTLLEFAADHNLDPKTATPEQVCDALVQACEDETLRGGTPPDNGVSWWDQQPTGVKVAIGVGGVALVGGIAYLALK